jgi:hypothetical protein
MGAQIPSGKDVDSQGRSELSSIVSPTLRHCGRCQQPFAPDPELFFQTDWALCPACEKILLPERRTSQVGAIGGDRAV